jgi:hypothetical protein
MTFKIDNFSDGRFSRSRLTQALLWMAAIVLALQLIGSAFHKHDLADESHDCVSCQIALHFPADLPAVNAVLQAVFLLVAYRIALLPRYVYVAEQSYLIPPRQAPPRFSISA